eukprot:TRINITY_DN2580_c0_g1_i2.p1 TRINITY_DN2580_c0_g1~~TRINITY_DN2580_c0_g1_i2.p1  ORF type:complete len:328 (+),score=79.21 TRINITY_DN2580_c0_g1_i2:100-984(+)
MASRCAIGSAVPKVTKADGGGGQRARRGGQRHQVSSGGSKALLEEASGAVDEVRAELTAWRSPSFAACKQEPEDSSGSSPDSTTSTAPPPSPLLLPVPAIDLAESSAWPSLREGGHGWDFCSESSDEDGSWVDDAHVLEMLEDPDADAGADGENGWWVMAKSPKLQAAKQPLEPLPEAAIPLLPERPTFSQVLAAAKSSEPEGASAAAAAAAAARAPRGPIAAALKRRARLASKDGASDADLLAEDDCDDDLSSSHPGSRNRRQGQESRSAGSRRKGAARGELRRGREEDCCDS